MFLPALLHSYAFLGLILCLLVCKHWIDTSSSLQTKLEAVCNLWQIDSYIVEHQTSTSCISEVISNSSSMNLVHAAFSALWIWTSSMITVTSTTDRRSCSKTQKNVCLELMQRSSKILQVASICFVHSSKPKAPQPYLF